MCRWFTRAFLPFFFLFFFEYPTWTINHLFVEEHFGKSTRICVDSSNGNPFEPANDKATRHHSLCRYSTWFARLSTCKSTMHFQLEVNADNNRHFLLTKSSSIFRFARSKGEFVSIARWTVNSICCSIDNPIGDLIRGLSPGRSGSCDKLKIDFGNVKRVDIRSAPLDGALIENPRFIAAFNFAAVE